MPPSLLQDSESDPIRNSAPYYTNDDIAILHDVVVYAQELLPNLTERERLPTNALFHAYYALLPSIGINADHDNRYARILFKIGGVRSSGSLYEKFEAVLARMGIEIQFDQQSNPTGYEVATEPYSTESYGSQVYAKITPEAGGQERGRRRRNSESSAWDEWRWSRGADRSRPGSHSSLFRPRRTSVDERVDNPGLIRQTAGQASHATLQNALSNDGAWEHDKNQGFGAWLNDDIDNYTKSTRARSVSTHRSLHIRRRSSQGGENRHTTIYTLHSHPNLRAAQGSFSQPSETKEYYGLEVGEPYHQKIPVPTLESPIDAKSILLGQFRTQSVERLILHRWQLKTLQLRKDNSNLELLARHRDRLVLLRQAFDSWHARIVDRHQAAETERFFAHLERRASRARDLFLLAKAITHWAHITVEEIQRTAVARRHIIRIRYFNSWRETTAINELKVRRHILRKFFCVWQKRQVRVMSTEQTAIHTMTEGLTKRCFWTWFWGFCERRAPTWQTDRLRKRQLTTWVTTSRGRGEHERDAFDFFCNSTSQRLYVLWIAKMRQTIIRNHQANDYYVTHNARRRLTEFQRAASLLPLHQTMRAETAAKIQRAFLRKWLSRSGQESDAAEIDRSKIIREAWISWNDKLRLSAIQSRICNRVVLQGLYRWVLAERLLLARRLLERTTMHKFLQKMVATKRVIAEKHCRHHISAQNWAKQRCSGNALGIWRQSLRISLQRQHFVSGFNSPLVMGDALTKWLNRFRQHQQLRCWSSDGEFYFLCNKTIRMWKLATRNIRREKRRIIYTKFRRNGKVNLAKRVFSKWHHEAQARIATMRRATDTNENKNTVFCVDLFDRWRGRGEEVAEMESTIHVSLLRKYFNEMKTILIENMRSELRAAEFLEVHLSTVSMKKWSRVALHLRARQHLVTELREKSLKKSSRKVIIHWRQRTSHVFSREKSSQRESGRDSYDTGNHANTEITALGSNLGDHKSDKWAGEISSTAFPASIPGYLSTPSKKISRARAIAMFHSTTPSAPLPTQIEMQLRAQYSGGPLSSFRIPQGKTLLGQKGISSSYEELSGTKGTETAGQ